jgi:ferric-dicitrate binding protein FerR (iron transport regulator)
MPFAMLVLKRQSTAPVRQWRRKHRQWCKQGNITMRTLTRIACAAILFAGLDAAPAQEAAKGCTSEHLPNAAQVLRCGGATIVAEDGAKFSLQDRDKNGTVDAVSLQSRAVLVDAGKQRGRNRFQVTTPQAIAAVRGTKWAVDAQETRTSVLVLRGRVAVRRPAGAGEVTLLPGQGVDVAPGTDALVVKTWAQPRVDALLARLGQ